MEIEFAKILQNDAVPLHTQIAYFLCLFKGDSQHPLTQELRKSRITMQWLVTKGENFANNEKGNELRKWCTQFEISMGFKEAE